MYYVLLFELRPVGDVTILNNGGFFTDLESAQFFCNEYISDSPRDFFEYFDLKIYEKGFSEDTYDIFFKNI